MSYNDRNKKSLSKLIDSVLNTILPPRCAATGEIVDIQGTISPNFWSELQFIEKPFCKNCGIPFSFEIDEDFLCAECIEIEPMFDQSRCAVVYNDASRRLVLNFKFNDKTSFVHTFVPWMIRAGKDLIYDSDYIIPIPLHPKKLRQRRFNQSALLAHEIAKKTSSNYLPDGLISTRLTKPQKGLSKKHRINNVGGAFAINDNHLDTFAHKKILLIDDIFTTGATLNEAARMLKNAGAAEVNVLTIARVTKDEYK